MAPTSAAAFLFGVLFFRRMGRARGPQDGHSLLTPSCRRILPALSLRPSSSEDYPRSPPSATTIREIRHENTDQKTPAQQTSVACLVRWRDRIGPMGPIQRGRLLTSNNVFLLSLNDGQ